MTPQRGRGNYNNTAGSKQGRGGKGRGDGGSAISMSVPPRPAIGHPKSKQVIRIEKLLKALHESSASSSSGKAKDPKGGCFCLGEAVLYENGMCCVLIHLRL